MANEPKWINIIFSESRSIQTWKSWEIHGNPRTQRAFEVNIWENHGTKWGWFHQVMFDCRRIGVDQAGFPSEHTKNYGTSPCFMGKLTISMAIYNKLW